MSTCSRTSSSRCACSTTTAMRARRCSRGSVRSSKPHPSSTSASFWLCGGRHRRRLRETAGVHDRKRRTNRPSASGSRDRRSANAGAGRRRAVPPSCRSPPPNRHRKRAAPASPGRARLHGRRQATPAEYAASPRPEAGGAGALPKIFRCRSGPRRCASVSQPARCTAPHPTAHCSACSVRSSAAFARSCAPSYSRLARPTTRSSPTECSRIIRG